MGTGKFKRPDFKKEYLEKMQEKKQNYFLKRKDIIRLSDFTNWKSYMIEGIMNAKAKFPTANWPNELISFCMSWNNYKDYPLRWNVIWYDYLKTTSQRDSIYRTTISQFYCPSLSQNLSYFEVDNIYELLHTQLLDSNNNFIGGIIVVFNTSFHQQYMEKLTQIDINTEIANHMLDEIKSFVLLAIEALSNYYGGIILEKMQNSPDKIYDFVLEETFLEYVHDVVIKGLLIENLSRETVYLEKIEKFQKLKCEDFGISEKFCLDCKANSLGYDKAINALKEIENVHSPFKKIQVVVATSRMICECIDDYWIGNGEMSAKELRVDSDQIISIFCYIVMKAAIKNLRGHVGLIQRFSRFSVNNGTMGYYVTTIEACIEKIESITENNW